MRHWKAFAAGIAAGIATAGILVGAVAIGYVIADRIYDPTPTTQPQAAQAAETQPTTTTTTTAPTTTTTAPTTIAAIVDVPKSIDSVDDIACISPWLPKRIIEAAAQSYEIFTFDKIQRIRKTSNKLWCQARVRASIGITQIEYTIEDIGGDFGENWYVTVQRIG